MINWINFLHIYQPPYQEKEVILRVVKESYWNLVNILKNRPQAKLTLNFSGCLLEHIYNIGEERMIDEFKTLLSNGQIELTGTARYHPILPLLPAKEIKRQIILNDNILKQAFGDSWHPDGFFLPEMAYSLGVAKILKKLNYKWIIIDEIAYKGKLGLVDYNKKYQIEGLGLKVVFRNRALSKTFVPDTVLDLTKKSNAPTILISATDGEMYGHHHQDNKNSFLQVLENPDVKTMTVSEYLNSLPLQPELINPLASSWESSPTELRNKVPYLLWQDPKNKIHQNLWKLRKIAIKAVNGSKEQGVNYEWARHHLDRGLSSCAWWWAADRKLDIFNFITWNPDAIEKGIKELISSIRSLQHVSKRTKLKAEKIYHLLIKEIWKKHWQKYHKTKSPEQKMPLEIKRALSLLNQNFLIKLFKEKIDLEVFKKNEIDYIAIKTFKKKIGKLDFYHIVAKYVVYFKNQKQKPISIFCNANSKESRLGAYLALKYLWEKNFSDNILRCPRPLFYQKQLKATFYLEATGKNLYQYLIDPHPDYDKIKKIVHLAGQWLAKLHNLPVKGVKNFNPMHSKVSTIIPGAKHFLKIIENKHSDYPAYHDQIKELYDKIYHLENQLNDGKKYIIHGDFHPENIVFNERKGIFYAIDYTDCCLAHFTRDLGSFYQQLAYMARKKLPKNKINELQKIFINSYILKRKLKLSAKDRKKFNLYKSWSALRSAVYFLTIVPFDRTRADLLLTESREYLKKIRCL
ncbi:hypothetical protein C4569_04200 [Candidatus Parcubacteria bacterium]|nr:MAG: hypothetical protein C4569_04200 [Candidatus Parcubacteria bacterium]